MRCETVLWTAAHTAPTLITSADIFVVGVAGAPRHPQR